MPCCIDYAKQLRRERVWEQPKINQCVVYYQQEEKEHEELEQKCCLMPAPVNEMYLLGGGRYVVPWYRTICRQCLCQRPECIGPFECEYFSVNIDSCNFKCDFPSKVPKRKKDKKLHISSKFGPDFFKKGVEKKEPKKEEYYEDTEE